MTHPFLAMATAPLALPPEGAAWWIVHTRPRCEKRLCGFCREAGLPYYLPLRERTHHYGTRKRTFSTPLFPGYVFVILPEERVPTVRDQRHVARCLRVVDSARLVEQLQHIDTALRLGKVVDVQPYLEEGRPVKVSSGPFKGFEGIVLRLKGKTRAIVNVDLIDRAVVFEVDGSLLAPA